MAKLKVKLNTNGVRELLRSSEMLNVCTQIASKAQSKLGDGYEVTHMVGKNRVNASIKAVTDKAKKESIENYSIIKALK